VAIVVLDDSEELTDDDLRLYDEVAERETDFIVVINKVDLGRGGVENEDVRQWVVGCNDTCGPIRVSALTGEGLDELEEKLRQKVYHAEGPQWERAVVTRARHREALESAAESIEQAVKTIEGGIPVDMATVDLREAVMSLGEITGETVEDAVLERIFADFCVGK
jgi:tRNA modification GTPase